MAGAPSILDQVYYCNVGKGFKIGDGVTPVADLPIVGGGSGIPGPPGKDGLPGPVGIVLDPDDPRVLQHNQQVGEVVAFYGDYAPVGTLLCDGSVLEIVDYRELGEFLIAQNQELDIGDGEHFMLPDMRDMFLRGQATGRLLGSLQNDAIRNITGVLFSMHGTGANPQPSDSALYWDYMYGNYCAAGQYATAHNTPVFDASRVVPTADENRPVNVAVSFAIRYTTSLLCGKPSEVGGGIPQTPNDNIVYGIRNNQLVPILAIPE